MWLHVHIRVVAFFVKTLVHTMLMLPVIAPPIIAANNVITKTPSWIKACVLWVRLWPALMSKCGKSDCSWPRNLWYCTTNVFTYVNCCQNSVKWSPKRLNFARVYLHTTNCRKASVTKITTFYNYLKQWQNKRSAEIIELLCELVEIMVGEDTLRSVNDVTEGSTQEAHMCAS